MGVAFVLGVWLQLVLTISHGAAWSPSFTLDMVTHDVAHSEASVPDVCDVAKRPVQFYHNEHRNCFDPHRKLDIVIAFSREKMEELQETINLLLAAPSFKYALPCVVVGSKVRNASQVLPLPGVDSVFELGHAGREWAVYMTYMVSYYDNLPEHVVFMHGRLNLPPEDLMPKFALFGPHTGLLGMINNGECSCTGCHLPAPTWRLRELWSIFRQSFCPQNYQAFLNGHYVVSRKRILANPVDLYKVVYRYVMHHPRHFLSEDSHEQMHSAPNHYVNFVNHLDTCEDTLGGHIVERAWSFLFNCYQQPHRDACAAFNGTAEGLNPTCAYSGWQCYDSMPPWPVNATAA